MRFSEASFVGCLGDREPFVRKDLLNSHSLAQSEKTVLA